MKIIHSIVYFIVIAISSNIIIIINNIKGNKQQQVFAFALLPSTKQQKSHFLNRYECTPVIVTSNRQRQNIIKGIIPQRLSRTHLYFSIKQKQQQQQQQIHHQAIKSSTFISECKQQTKCQKRRLQFQSKYHSNSFATLVASSSSSTPILSYSLSTTSSVLRASLNGDDSNDSDDVIAVVESTNSNNDDDSLPTTSASIKNTIRLLQSNTDLIAIIVIYFVEGALGIARLAQTLLLKDELHLGPAELSALSGLFVLPWTIKPIYGFLSDSIPLAGYRRKSYLIAAGIIGTLSYTLLGQQGKLWDVDSINAAVVDIGTQSTTTTTTSFTLTIILLIVSSACIAFSDVVADGIIVTKSRSLATVGNEIIEEHYDKIKATTSSSAADSNIDIAPTGDSRSSNNNNDGIGVTRVVANDNSAASLQSLCWGASAIGSLIAAYFSGSILQVLTPRDVFGFTAILPFAVAAISTTIKEQPIVISAAGSSNSDSTVPTATETTIKAFSPSEKEISSSSSADYGERLFSSWPDQQVSSLYSAPSSSTSLQDTLTQQITAVKDAFSKPEIWKPTLFLFLWQSTPSSGGAFLYFIMNDLHVTTDTLGRLQFATAIATLVGVVLYNRFLQTISIRSILIWTTLLSLPLGLIPPILLITHVNRDYNIPDVWLLYGDDVALAALGQIGFLPTLVIAAKLCPPGIEAVLFATLMSIYNLAGTVGTELGALLTKLFGITESNFDNLIWLTIICNVTSIWPLLLIDWLNVVDNDSSNDNEQDNKNDSSGSRNLDITVLVEASKTSITNTTTILL
jgi:folate/biopterin transporter